MHCNIHTVLSSSITDFAVQWTTTEDVRRKKLHSTLLLLG